MASDHKRIVVLSFDGLNSRQFEMILGFMPEFKKIVDGMSHADLDSRPFTASAPIWAEILTGKPWYENGCSAHTQPLKSLNQVEVFSEENLLQSVSQPFSDKKGACINIPLLLPQPNRAWLSDGSMAIQMRVTPPALASGEPFNRYKPRAFDSLPYAMAMSKPSTRKCFEVERNRLECAAALAQRAEYEWLLLRLSIFDELAHFYGDAWLDEPDLWFRSDLEQFFAFADERLKIICAEASVFVLSAFSHSLCVGTVNLNLILRKGDFLELHTDAKAIPKGREKARRAEAIEAITGQRVPKGRLQSAQGLLLTDETTAASPAAGCIYTNDSERFSDGLVQVQDRKDVCESVSSFLQKELSAGFGDHFQIWRAPAQGSASSLVPDCIVFIDQVELTDALKPSSANSRTATMHAPKGFLYGPEPALKGRTELSPSLAGKIIAGCEQDL